MMNSFFSEDLFLGIISKVNTYSCYVKIPKPNLLQSFYFEREQYSGGIVGKYVIVKSENLGFLGIIQEISLPKNTDYTLEDFDILQDDIFKTDCRIQLLLSFEYENLSDSGGITSHGGIKEFPLVGSKIYICHSNLLKMILNGINDKSDISLLIGKVINNGLPFKISIIDLFVRHCAIVGTTGGGKSYTIGKIIEELNKYNKEKNAQKINLILFDATGEFESLGVEDENIKRYKFGELSEKNKQEKMEPVYFSYKNFSTSDWFALFNPSANVQAIKLREAIKSLKLCYVKKQPDASCKDNFYKKEKSSRKNYLDDIEKYKEIVYNDETSEFDTTFLTNQISEECVYLEDKDKDGSKSNFGVKNPTEEGWCIPLINKISYKVKNPIYQKIFNFNNKIEDTSIKDVVEILTEKNAIKIISLKDVSFDDNMRPVLINCIGRFFLDKARKGDYKKNPTVLILDEAHQFLNTKINGEYSPDIHLNAFDNIAKECRKHGLHVCLSTQMPRDIPSVTLSQVGTFIVHRLINEEDKNKIKDACQESTREIMSYLPILGKGECILISNRIPMPLHVKIDEPSDDFKPNSKSPLEKLLEELLIKDI